MPKKIKLTEPNRFCPVAKTAVYKKDCLAIRCRYHKFWSGFWYGEVKSESACQYRQIKKQMGGGE
jgi:hypothetical protein